MLCAPPVHPSPLTSQALAATDLFSVSNLIPLSFHGLIAHAFLVMNNTALSECTTVYLTMFLLKYVSVASKLWQL